jgi:hypothetical protein
MRTNLLSVALVFSLAASGASAATYQAVLHGVLVSGSDSTGDLQVGAPVTMTARFDDSLITGFNPSTLTGVADVFGLPLTGKNFYQLTVGSLVYKSTDDILDGDFGPLITFSGGKITGFATASDSYPGRPPLPYFASGTFGQAPNAILIHSSVYTAYEANFSGVWDLADSFVRGVPEPATWGLMLTGFFGLGATLRLRTRHRRAALAGV